MSGRPPPAAANSSNTSSTGGIPPTHQHSSRMPIATPATVSVSPRALQARELLLSVFLNSHCAAVHSFLHEVLYVDTIDEAAFVHYFHHSRSATKMKRNIMRVLGGTAPDRHEYQEAMQADIPHCGADGSTQQQQVVSSSSTATPILSSRGMSDPHSRTPSATALGGVAAEDIYHQRSLSGPMAMYGGPHHRSASNVGRTNSLKSSRTGFPHQQQQQQQQPFPKGYVEAYDEKGFASAGVVNTMVENIIAIRHAAVMMVGGQAPADIVPASHAVQTAVNKFNWLNQGRDVATAKKATAIVDVVTLLALGMTLLGDEKALTHRCKLLLHHNADSWNLYGQHRDGVGVSTSVYNTPRDEWNGGSSGAIHPSLARVPLYHLHETQIQQLTNFAETFVMREHQADLPLTIRRAFQDYGVELIRLLSRSSGQLYLPDVPEHVAVYLTRFQHFIEDPTVVRNTKLLARYTIITCMLHPNTAPALVLQLDCAQKLAKITKGRKEAKMMLCQFVTSCFPMLCYDGYHGPERRVIEPIATHLYNTTIRDWLAKPKYNTFSVPTAAVLLCLSSKDILAHEFVPLHATIMKCIADSKDRNRAAPLCALLHVLGYFLNWCSGPPRQASRSAAAMVVASADGSTNAPPAIPTAQGTHSASDFVNSLGDLLLKTSLRKTAPTEAALLSLGIMADMFVMISRTKIDDGVHLVVSALPSDPAHVFTESTFAAVAALSVLTELAFDETSSSDQLSDWTHKVSLPYWPCPMIGSTASNISTDTLPLIFASPFSSIRHSSEFDASFNGGTSIVDVWSAEVDTARMNVPTALSRTYLQAVLFNHAESISRSLSIILAACEKECASAAHLKHYTGAGTPVKTTTQYLSSLSEKDRMYQHLMCMSLLAGRYWCTVPPFFNLLPQLLLHMSPDVHRVVSEHVLPMFFTNLSYVHHAQYAVQKIVDTISCCLHEKAFVVPLGSYLVQYLSMFAQRVGYVQNRHRLFLEQRASRRRENGKASATNTSIGGGPQDDDDPTTGHINLLDESPFSADMDALLVAMFSSSMQIAGQHWTMATGTPTLSNSIGSVSSPMSANGQFSQPSSSSQRHQVPPPAATRHSSDSRSGSGRFISSGSVPMMNCAAPMADLLDALAITLVGHPDSSVRVLALAITAHVKAVHDLFYEGRSKGITNSAGNSNGNEDDDESTEPLRTESEDGFSSKPKSPQAPPPGVTSSNDETLSTEQLRQIHSSRVSLASLLGACGHVLAEDAQEQIAKGAAQGCNWGDDATKMRRVGSCLFYAPHSTPQHGDFVNVGDPPPQLPSTQVSYHHQGVLYKGPRNIIKRLSREGTSFSQYYSALVATQHPYVFALLTASHFVQHCPFWTLLSANRLVSTTTNVGVPGGVSAWTATALSLQTSGSGGPTAPQLPPNKFEGATDEKSYFDVWKLKLVLSLLLSFTTPKSHVEAAVDYATVANAAPSGNRATPQHHVSAKERFRQLLVAPGDIVPFRDAQLRRATDLLHGNLLPHINKFVIVQDIFDTISFGFSHLASLCNSVKTSVPQLVINSQAITLPVLEFAKRVCDEELRVLASKSSKKRALAVGAVITSMANAVASHALSTAPVADLVLSNLVATVLGATSAATGLNRNSKEFDTRSTNTTGGWGGGSVATVPAAGVTSSTGAAHQQSLILVKLFDIIDFIISALVIGTVGATAGESYEKRAHEIVPNRGGVSKTALLPSLPDVLVGPAFTTAQNSPAVMTPTHPSTSSSSTHSQQPPMACVWSSPHTYETSLTVRIRMMLFSLFEVVTTSGRKCQSFYRERLTLWVNFLCYNAMPLFQHVALADILVVNQPAHLLRGQVVATAAASTPCGPQPSASLQQFFTSVMKAISACASLPLHSYFGSSHSIEHAGAIFFVFEKLQETLVGAGFGKDLMPIPSITEVDTIKQLLINLLSANPKTFFDVAVAKIRQTTFGTVSCAFWFEVLSAAIVVNPSLLESRRMRKKRKAAAAAAAASGQPAADSPTPSSLRPWAPQEGSSGGVSPRHQHQRTMSKQPGKDHTRHSSSVEVDYFSTMESLCGPLIFRSLCYIGTSAPQAHLARQFLNLLFAPQTPYKDTMFTAKADATRSTAFGGEVDYWCQILLQNCGTLRSASMYNILCDLALHTTRHYYAASNKSSDSSSKHSSSHGGESTSSKTASSPSHATSSATAHTSTVASQHPLHLGSTPRSALSSTFHTLLSIIAHFIMVADLKSSLLTQMLALTKQFEREWSEQLLLMWRGVNYNTKGSIGAACNAFIFSFALKDQVTIAQFILNPRGMKGKSATAGSSGGGKSPNTSYASDGSDSDSDGDGGEDPIGQYHRGLIAAVRPVEGSIVADPDADDTTFCRELFLTAFRALQQLKKLQLQDDTVAPTTSLLSEDEDDEAQASSKVPEYDWTAVGHWSSLHPAAIARPRSSSGGSNSGHHHHRGTHHRGGSSRSSNLHSPAQHATSSFDEPHHGSAGGELSTGCASTSSTGLAWLQDAAMSETNLFTSIASCVSVLGLVGPRLLEHPEIYELLAFEIVMPMMVAKTMQNAMKGGLSSSSSHIKSDSIVHFAGESVAHSFMPDATLLNPTKSGASSSPIIGAIPAGGNSSSNSIVGQPVVSIPASSWQQAIETTATTDDRTSSTASPSVVNSAIGHISKKSSMSTSHQRSDSNDSVATIQFHDDLDTVEETHGVKDLPAIMQPGGGGGGGRTQASADNFESGTIRVKSVGFDTDVVEISPNRNLASPNPQHAATRSAGDDMKAALASAAAERELLSAQRNASRVTAEFARTLKNMILHSSVLLVIHTGIATSLQQQQQGGSSAAATQHQPKSVEWADAAQRALQMLIRHQMDATAQKASSTAGCTLETVQRALALIEESLSGAYSIDSCAVVGGHASSSAMMARSQLGVRQLDIENFLGAVLILFPTGTACSWIHEATRWSTTNFGQNNEKSNSKTTTNLEDSDKLPPEVAAILELISTGDMAPSRSYLQALSHVVMKYLLSFAASRSRDELVSNLEEVAARSPDADIFRSRIAFNRFVQSKLLSLQVVVEPACSSLLNGLARRMAFLSIDERSIIQSQGPVHYQPSHSSKQPTPYTIPVSNVRGRSSSIASNGAASGFGGSSSAGPYVVPPSTPAAIPYHQRESHRQALGLALTAAKAVEAAMLTTVIPTTIGVFDESQPFATSLVAEVTLYGYYWSAFVQLLSNHYQSFTNGCRMLATLYNSGGYQLFGSAGISRVPHSLLLSSSLLATLKIISAERCALLIILQKLGSQAPASQGSNSWFPHHSFVAPDGTTGFSPEKVLHDMHSRTPTKMSSTQQPPLSPGGGHNSGNSPTGANGSFGSATADGALAAAVVSALQAYSTTFPGAAPFIAAMFAVGAAGREAPFPDEVACKLHRAANDDNNLFASLLLSFTAVSADGDVTSIRKLVSTMISSLYQHPAGGGGDHKTNDEANAGGMDSLEATVTFAGSSTLRDRRDSGHARLPSLLDPTLDDDDEDFDDDSFDGYDANGVPIPPHHRRTPSVQLDHWQRIELELIVFNTLVTSLSNPSAPESFKQRALVFLSELLEVGLHNTDVVECFFIFSDEILAAVSLPFFSDNPQLPSQVSDILSRFLSQLAMALSRRKAMKTFQGDDAGAARFHSGNAVSLLEALQSNWEMELGLHSTIALLDHNSQRPGSNDQSVNRSSVLSAALQQAAVAMSRTSPARPTHASAPSRDSAPSSTASSPHQTPRGGRRDTLPGGSATPADSAFLAPSHPRGRHTRGDSVIIGHNEEVGMGQVAKSHFTSLSAGEGIDPFADMLQTPPPRVTGGTQGQPPKRPPPHRRTQSTRFSENAANDDMFFEEKQGKNIGTADPITPTLGHTVRGGFSLTESVRAAIPPSPSETTGEIPAPGSTNVSPRNSLLAATHKSRLPPVNALPSGSGSSLGPQQKPLSPDQSPRHESSPSDLQHPSNVAPTLEFPPILDHSASAHSLSHSHQQFHSQQYPSMLFGAYIYQEGPDGERMDLSHVCCDAQLLNADHMWPIHGVDSNLPAVEHGRFDSVEFFQSEDGGDDTPMALRHRSLGRERSGYPSNVAPLIAHNRKTSYNSNNPPSGSGTRNLPPFIEVGAQSAGSNPHLAMSSEEALMTESITVLDKPPSLMGDGGTGQPSLGGERTMPFMPSDAQGGGAHSPSSAASTASRRLSDDGGDDDDESGGSCVHHSMSYDDSSSSYDSDSSDDEVDPVARRLN